MQTEHIHILYKMPNGQSVSEKQQQQRQRQRQRQRIRDNYKRQGQYVAGTIDDVAVAADDSVNAEALISHLTVEFN